MVRESRSRSHGLHLRQHRTTHPGAEHTCWYGLHYPVYAYDEGTNCMSQTTRDLKEEGEYEYVSDGHGASGKEEGHIEPEILVQPLGTQAGEGDSEDDGSEFKILNVEYKKNPCAERPGRGGRSCKKESERQHMTPFERCLLAAGAGVLVSWIPGVDIDSGDAAAAACSAAVGSPGGPQKW